MDNSRGTENCIVLEAACQFALHYIRHVALLVDSTCVCRCVETVNSQRGS